jgi:hypothetical protein
VDAIGVEQDALGQGGFSRVNMGADPDVSEFCEVDTHD